MYRVRVGFLASIIILGIMSIIPVSPLAHALPNGVVCVNLTTSSSCNPSTPASITGLAVGSTLTVAVNLFNSSTTNGFLISLKVDPTILNPISANGTGSIVPTYPGTAFTVTPANCINGSGTGCTSIDGPGVITFGILSVGGLSISPTTGRQFLANYKVVGTTGLTTIGYVTGSACTGTSIPNTCVTITSGTSTPDTESLAQPLNFGKQPGFEISATPASLSLVQSQSKTSQITVTSIGNFTGAVALTPTVSPTVTNGPTATLATSSVTVPAGGTATDILNVVTTATTPTGSYSVAVTSPHALQNATVAVAVSAIVPMPDFTVSASPPSISLQAGANASSTVTVTGVNGFTGTITLKTTVSPVVSNGPVAFFSTPNTIILSSKVTSGSSTLVISTVRSTPVGGYNVTVAATNGTISHTFVVALAVQPPLDFSVGASQPSLTVPIGTNSTDTIFLAGENGFSGMVTLNLTVTPLFGAPIALLSSSTVFVGSGMPTSVLLVVIATPFTQVGSYTVQVTATSGTLSHSVRIAVSVVQAIAMADFNITATPMFLTVVLGSSANSTISLSSLNGFAGQVSLNATLQFPNPELTVSLNPTTVMLSSGRNATSVLTVKAKQLSEFQFFGTFFVTVAAKSGSLVHFATVEVRVVPPPFQLSAFPNNLILVQGSSAQSLISVFSNGGFFGFVNLSGFVGFVNLAATVSPLVQNGPTVSFNTTRVFLNSTNFGFVFEIRPATALLTIMTLTSTPAMGYTVTVTGSNGTFSSSTTIALKVIPPPVLILTPSEGPMGTKVLVQGSGFPVSPFFFGETQMVEITFDDQFVGVGMLNNKGSFNFTFNVPVAEAGSHTVKAIEFLWFTVIVGEASFQVLPLPLAISVNATTGPLYFPGDTAVIYALTNVNGTMGPANVKLQVLLVKPDGSNTTLTSKTITQGLFRATYAIPSSGSLGTYAVLVRANATGYVTGFALTSFEVKPSYVSPGPATTSPPPSSPPPSTPPPTVQGAAALTSILAASTLAALAIGIAIAGWRYLARRKTAQTTALQ